MQKNQREEKAKKKTRLVEARGADHSPVLVTEGREKDERKEERK